MKVPISGQVTGKEEIDNITQVANSQHYGGGEWMHKFERGSGSVYRQETCNIL